MTSTPLTKIAVFTVLFVNGPALAQDVGPRAATSAAQIAAPALDAATAVRDNAVSISEAIKFKPMTRLPSTPLETPQDSISNFVHTTTIQPILRVAHAMGDWIASSSDAVVVVLQDTGRWAVSKSNCVANAARNTGEWIYSSSNAMVFAVQDTSGWVVTNSSAAVDVAVEAASATVSGLTMLENWSVKLVKEIETHLRMNGTSEFATLVKESGFALTDVKVGVGIVPELAVEFRHERDLTPEEVKAFKAKIKEHAKTASGAKGYFEKILLSRILKAGEYSGGMRISEVNVDLFPFPGLEVFFDPFRYEEDQNKMLLEAFNQPRIYNENLKSIEERITKIETMLPVANDKK